MILKKDQLRAKEIESKYMYSLVRFFHTLGKLDLCHMLSTMLKPGQVIHFCKRNLRPEKRHSPGRTQ